MGIGLGFLFRALYTSDVYGDGMSYVATSALSRVTAGAGVGEPRAHAVCG